MNNAQTNSPQRGRPRGPTKVKVTLWVQPASYQAAQKAAYRKNLSFAQLVDDVLRRECAAYLPAEEAAPAERATA